MGVKHNGFQVSASLKRRAKSVSPATRAVARSMGQIMRDAIREQIPPDTPNNAWDAYAATGKLKSYVVASEPVKTATGWKVSVYVPRYKLAYFRVHEEGKIIRPKGRWLVFPYPPSPARYTRVPGRKTFIFQDKGTGQWMIATEYVIIRPKRYFAKGSAEGKQIVKATIDKEWQTIVRQYGVTT